MRNRIFLLSPAYAGGKRARMIVPNSISPAVFAAVSVLPLVKFSLS
jgi:hypothetical protein